MVLLVPGVACTLSDYKLKKKKESVGYTFDNLWTFHVVCEHKSHFEAHKNHIFRKAFPININFSISNRNFRSIHFSRFCPWNWQLKKCFIEITALAIESVCTENVTQKYFKLSFFHVNIDMIYELPRNPFEFSPKWKKNNSWFMSN